jgi:hypothetical protein
MMHSSGLTSWNGEGAREKVVKTMTSVDATLRAKSLDWLLEQLELSIVAWGERPLSPRERAYMARKLVTVVTALGNKRARAPRKRSAAAVGGPLPLFV